jgi:hypothetical protein
MKKILMALAVLAIATMSRAAYAANAQTELQPTAGVWAAVCCGTKCLSGQDYCIGTGPYTCCK